MEKGEYYLLGVFGMVTQAGYLVTITADRDEHGWFLDLDGYKKGTKIEQTKKLPRHLTEDQIADAITQELFDVTGLHPDENCKIYEFYCRSTDPEKQIELLTTTNEIFANIYTEMKQMGYL